MMNISNQQLDRALRKIMKPYCISSTVIGLSLFVWDYVLFLILTALVIIVPEWWLQLIFSILSGFKIANLATLSHDACHNSLTRSRKLNTVLGIVGFLPGLFNYRLWLYDHHNIHHRKTNSDHPDSFTPLSFKEYSALTRRRKLLYRFYRSPTLISFGVYYIAERWWKVKFIPRRGMPDNISRSGWRYFIILLIYLFAFNAALVIGSLHTDVSIISAILFGFVIPFFVFQTLFSFTVYIQHNHERAPWFRQKETQDFKPSQAFISVHLKLPSFASTLVHNVYDHSAHHILPGIPSYRLHDAQLHLNSLLGEHALVENFSIRRILEIMRNCKLYNYDTHQWIGYDGRPTCNVLKGDNSSNITTVYN